MDNNDKYIFSHPTVSGQPGFDMFKNEENGMFYFHFNDEGGQPLLFSQGYQGEDGRDNGINSVIKNGGIRKRYQMTELDGKIYIVLKAGNHLEIARSRPFDDEATAKGTIAYLMNKLPEATTDPVAMSSKSPSNGKREKTMPSGKFAFRIDFYKGGKDEPLAGRIEHLSTHKKVNFSGLDKASIMRFMEERIPEESLPGRHPGMSEAAEAAVPKGMTKPEEGIAPPKGPVHFSIPVKMEVPKGDIRKASKRPSGAKPSGVIARKRIEPTVEKSDSRIMKAEEVGPSGNIRIKKQPPAKPEMQPSRVMKAAPVSAKPRQQDPAPRMNAVMPSRIMKAEKRQPGPDENNGTRPMRKVILTGMDVTSRIGPDGRMMPQPDMPDRVIMHQSRVVRAEKIEPTTP